MKCFPSRAPTAGIPFLYALRNDLDFKGMPATGSTSAAHALSSSLASCRVLTNEDHMVKATLVKEAMQDLEHRQRAGLVA